MFNFKYLVGGAALVLATSAMAGGPEQVPAAPAPVANSGFYINANGGLNLLTNNNANNSILNSLGWNAGAAFGYHFSNNIRLEVAGNYWRHAVRSQFNNLGLPALQMFTLMGNVYYDFDFGNSIVPYVGAGLGWANQWASTTVQNITVSASQNYLAAQGIVGLDYKITDNVRVGVNYHLVGFAGNNGNNQFRRTNNLENQFNIGLSYYF